MRSRIETTADRFHAAQPQLSTNASPAEFSPSSNNFRVAPVGYPRPLRTVVENALTHYD